jgi:hypothetical protein
MRDQVFLKRPSRSSQFPIPRPNIPCKPVPTPKDSTNAKVETKTSNPNPIKHQPCLEPAKTLLLCPKLSGPPSRNPGTRQRTTTLAIPPPIAITIIPTPTHIRLLLAKAATTAAMEPRKDILLALAQLVPTTRPTSPTSTVPHPLRHPQARKPARGTPIRRAATASSFTAIITTTTTPVSLRQLKAPRIAGTRIVAAARARQLLPPAEQRVEVRDGGAEDDEEDLDCGPHLEDDEVPCLWEVSWGGCGLRGRGRGGEGGPHRLCHRGRRVL